MNISNIRELSQDTNSMSVVNVMEGLTHGMTVAKTIQAQMAHMARMAQLASLPHMA